MTTNLNADLSTLTQISKKTLDELTDTCNLCIAHSVFESYVSHSDMTEIDIGIGKLYIKLTDREVKYKFIPSKQLDIDIINAVIHKDDPLTHRLELNLKERIERTYKGIL